MQEKQINVIIAYCNVKPILNFAMHQFQYVLFKCVGLKERFLLSLLGGLWNNMTGD